MSDENKDGVQPPSGSADGENNKKVENSVETITYVEHKKGIDKVLSDMHKFKSELKDMKAEKEKLETEKLKETENYKTLYEREKERADKSDVDAKENRDAYFTTQKFDAVKNCAIEAGLRPEAAKDLELLNLDDVVIEKTDQGRFSLLGVKTKVEAIKKQRPHWFRSANPPNIDTRGGAPGGTDDKELTADYMSELQTKDPKKYRELLPAFATQAVIRMNKREGITNG